MSKRVRKDMLQIPVECWTVIMDFVNTTSDLLNLLLACKNFYEYYSKCGLHIAKNLWFSCDLTKLKKPTVLTRMANRVVFTKVWAPQKSEEEDKYLGIIKYTVPDQRTLTFRWSYIEKYQELYFSEETVIKYKCHDCGKYKKDWEKINPRWLDDEYLRCPFCCGYSKCSGCLEMCPNDDLDAYEKCEDCALVCSECSDCVEDEDEFFDGKCYHCSGRRWCSGCHLFIMENVYQNHERTCKSKKKWI